MLVQGARIYSAGYRNGARLSGIQAALDKNFADLDLVEDGYYLRLGVGDYVIGFSDGWHGVPPLIAPEESS